MSTACEDYSWGLAPRDSQVNNLVVKDHAVICDLTAAIGGGGGGIGGLTTVVTAFPLEGDGSATNPVTFVDGDVGALNPEYPIWTNGNAWTITELQCLERKDNVITLCNSESPVDLSVLGPLLTPGSDGVVLCLSGDSTLGSQCTLTCNETTRTVTLKAPDGNLLNGTATTQDGSSVVLENSNNPGGGIFLLGGTYGGVSPTKRSNIFLAPNQNGNYGAVYIGNVAFDSPSHLGSLQSTAPTIARSGGAASYYVVSTPVVCTDMAGQISLQYVPDGPQTRNADLVTVTFHKQYNGTPRAVLLSPMNADGWNAALVVGILTGNGFTLRQTGVKVYNDGSGGGGNLYPPNPGFRWVNLGIVFDLNNTGIYPVQSPPSANGDTIDLNGLGAGSTWTATVSYLVIE